MPKIIYIKPLEWIDTPSHTYFISTSIYGFPNTFWQLYRDALKQLNFKIYCEDNDWYIKYECRITHNIEHIIAKRDHYINYFLCKFIRRANAEHREICFGHKKISAIICRNINNANEMYAEFMENSNEHDFYKIRINSRCDYKGRITALEHEIYNLCHTFDANKIAFLQNAAVQLKFLKAMQLITYSR
jgi:hypothetical protein